MKTIEMKTVYEACGGLCIDIDGREISVVRDGSHDGFSVLQIDGVRHLIADVDTLVNPDTGGIWACYRCFEPSPGVKYRAVVDGQDVGGGLAAITHNGQWYDVTESCRFNGIIVAGADLKSQTATV